MALLQNLESSRSTLILGMGSKALPECPSSKCQFLDLVIFASNFRSCVFLLTQGGGEIQQTWQLLLLRITDLLSPNKWSQGTSKSA